MFVFDWKWCRCICISGKKCIWPQPWCWPSAMSPYGVNYRPQWVKVTQNTCMHSTQHLFWTMRILYGCVMQFTEMRVNKPESVTTSTRLQQPVFEQHIGVIIRKIIQSVDIIRFKKKRVTWENDQKSEYSTSSQINVFQSSNFGHALFKRKEKWLPGGRDNTNNIAYTT